MQRLTWGILLVAIPVLVFGQMVFAQEPCKGEGIDVLNADICGAEMWITAKDSATVCQIICVVENPEDPGKVCGIDPSWIGEPWRLMRMPRTVSTSFRKLLRLRRWWPRRCKPLPARFPRIPRDSPADAGLCRPIFAKSGKRYNSF